MIKGDYQVLFCNNLENSDKIMKVWKAENVKIKKNYTNKTLLALNPHDTSACQYSQLK